MINDSFTSGGTGVVPTKNRGEHRENDRTLFAILLSLFAPLFHMIVYQCLLRGVYTIGGVLISEHTNYGFNIIFDNPL